MVDVELDISISFSYFLKGVGWGNYVWLEGSMLKSLIVFAFQKRFWKKLNFLFFFFVSILFLVFSYRFVVLMSKMNFKK
jgi:hypothetical protein